MSLSKTTKDAMQCAIDCMELWMKGYPDRRWEGMMHEESCDGVMHLPEERDTWQKCTCDGDDLVKQYKGTLRNLKRMVKM